MEKEIIDYTREEKLAWADKELEIFETDNVVVEGDDPDDMKEITAEEFRNTVRATFAAYKTFTEFNSGKEITDPNPEFTGLILSIFESLLKNRPISYIKGTDDEWNQIDENVYQNKRCTTLRKYVNEDGTVRYEDSDLRSRFDVIDDRLTTGIYETYLYRTIAELFPIEMPYNADTEYRIHIESDRFTDPDIDPVFQAFKIVSVYNYRTNEYDSEEKYFIFDKATYKFNKVSYNEYIDFKAAIAMPFGVKDKN